MTGPASMYQGVVHFNQQRDPEIAEVVIRKQTSQQVLSLHPTPSFPKTAGKVDEDD